VLTWSYADGIISATLAVGYHLVNDRGGVDFDAVAAAFLGRNIEVNPRPATHATARS